MQVVRAVVARQAVPDAVEREPAARDAIGHAAHGGAKIRMLRQISVQSVEAEHHVGTHAVTVGHVQREQRSAVAHDPRGHAGVAQHVAVDVRAHGAVTARAHARAVAGVAGVVPGEGAKANALDAGAHGR